jgi:type II secretory pathway pseudopilin PulG
MGEAALKLVEQELPVNQKALTYSEIVAALPPIKTADEYIRIGDLWKEGRALLKEIDDGYDDLIKAAHKLHKDAVAKKARYYNPVDGAVRAAKSLMSDYDLEQERIRQEEQRRLAEEARKQAEEQALLDAIAAEEEAKRNGATTEEATQAASQIIEEPVYVPPVVVPKSTPKLSGGPVYRTIWKFRIKDVNAIPRQYMMPNETAIGGVVRSLKGQANIPGVEVYEDRV